MCCSADKKWFVQPSLSVLPGALTESMTLFDVSKSTIAQVGQCVLHMETAAVLELRKVLRKSNPAHLAILQAAGLATDEASVPTPSINQFFSNPSKSGIKRKVPCSGFVSQTTVDLSGRAPRTYVTTSQVDCIDLT